MSTGECINGAYYWSSDMVLIDFISRKRVEEEVEYLLKEDKIAREIAQILIKCNEETLPHIREILLGDAYDWKYSCLAFVVEALPKETDIERLAFNPSQDEEALFEINNEARNILNSIEYNFLN